MSRIIKKFPYNPALKDEVQATASLIKDYDLMTVTLDYIDLDDRSQDNTCKVRLNSYCYALEESKGVHLYLEELDENDKPTGHKTEEIVVDEEKFVDEAYKCVVNAENKKKGFSRSTYVQSLLLQLSEKYAIEKLPDQRVFFQIPYQGIGYIYEDDILVSIVDTLAFAENNIICDHCVGKIENPLNMKIMFWTNSRCMIFEDIDLEHTYNDGVTYRYVFRVEEKPILTEDLAPDIPPTEFSKDIDSFVTERTRIIIDAEPTEEKEDDMLNLL